jgi:surfeit locus 1 family protein
MIARLRPLLAPAIATILLGGVCVSLGIWQLRRLAWKEGIIATIAARTTAPPQRLPPRSAWAALKPADYEYRRVTFTGTFDHDEETPVFRGGAGGAGYLILTPLRLDTGGTVLVDRGWVPSERKAKAAHAAGNPTGQVTVTGLMREPEDRNAFTPPDDPAQNTFFTRDPAEIAQHLGLADAAPFTVDADATPNPGGWPRGGATQVDIPNNHFSYAMTWFGLALGLFGVFIVLVWKRLSRGDADAGSMHAASASAAKRADSW